jgi:hypothetical protein
LNPGTGKYFAVIFFLAFLLPPGLQGQEDPDTIIVTDLSQVPAEELKKDTGRTVIPGRAALYSTIFPGLGQIYNRKYWKLPIVYGALGIATYAAIWNNQQSKIYLDAFYQQTDPNNPDPDFFGIYTEAQLIELYYQHRRWQDLSIIIGAVLYGLQILDAYVDAHLYDYDVSDDISLHWQPSLINLGYQSLPALGIGLTLSIK